MVGFRVTDLAGRLLGVFRSAHDDDTVDEMDGIYGDASLLRAHSNGHLSSNSRTEEETPVEALRQNGFL